MAGKPFDATIKDLVDVDAPSWTALVSSTPPSRVSFEDSDVSVVSAAADKVLRVEDADGEWLLNLEPQSSHAGDAPDAMLKYSVLLEQRHKCPVRSALLLLRPEANASAATGVLEKRYPGKETPYLVFHYDVIRLWEQPLERFLGGGLGTLPLAALTDDAKNDLGDVVARIDERLRQEATPSLAAKLRAATYLLLGLRYEEKDIVEAFAKGSTMIEESTTYQGILRRGRTTEAQRTLLRQGATKFGQPADAETVKRIEGFSDLEQLQALLDRILSVSSWDELLAGM